MDKRSTGEKVFNIFNLVFLTVFALLALYPFIYTLTISLSTASEVHRNSLHLYPREISFAAYQMVLNAPDIVTGYMNTIIRTVIGTILTVLVTCIAAYPLSRKELPNRGTMIFIILFTMIFGGGIVPGYLLIKDLGMMNSMWSLTIPTILSAFNIIIVKNFFQAIPESLAEAARVEGASEARILFQIYIPLSKPVLATIALWTAVGHWNAWFDAMLYISDDRKQVLQNFLQRIIIGNNTQLLDNGLSTITQFTPESVKAAMVIVTILPIILVYPFVQKYFVKGIVLGGVNE